MNLRREKSQDMPPGRPCSVLARFFVSQYTVLFFRYAVADLQRLSGLYRRNDRWFCLPLSYFFLLFVRITKTDES